MATRTIGSGGNDANIATWEAGLGTLSAQQTGDLLAQAFAESPIFSGSVTTSTFYAHLQAQSGAQHDGRAHAVSGDGNARITGTGGALSCVDSRDDHFRFSWFEIAGPGNNDLPCIRVESVAAAGEIQVHHLLIHNDDASAGGAQYGIYINDVDVLAKCYRNIVYGVGYSGIGLSAMTTNSVVYNNTFWNCNNSASAFGGGIATSDTDALIEGNASFANSNLDIRNLAGTLDYNYTSDTTGDDEGTNGLASLTTTDQFTNATTTWASTDLTHKSGSNLAAASVPTKSNSTYPEIDYAADNRNTAITGDWDVGACQYVAAGGSTRGGPFGHRGTAFNGGRTFHGIIQ